MRAAGLGARGEHLASRCERPAMSGATIARMTTYPATNGESRSSSPADAAMVARIRANSPRASRVVATFATCWRPKPYRRPATSPARTFMTTVSATAASTGQTTLGRSPGSMESPKPKKKIAAKASRSGWTSSLMRSPEAVLPSIRPTMKAPIASATPNSSAIPATRTAAPRKEITSNSLSLMAKTRPTIRVPNRARSARTRRKANALPICSEAAARSSAPERSGWRAARWSAGKTSSTTMMPRIGLVSPLPMRPRSTSVFVTIAEDEMPSTPARTSASRCPGRGGSRRRDRRRRRARGRGRRRPSSCRRP